MTLDRPNHDAGGTTALAGLALIIAFTFVFVSRGVADTWMVLLLPIEQEFGWSRQSSTSVYAVYMLTNGLSAPLSGLLLDRYGPRTCYLVGLAMLGVAMFGASQVSELWHLYGLIGVLTGAAVSAIGMIPASALISRWHRKNMSTAMAVAYAGFGLGTLLLAPLVQLSIEAFGWRGAYLQVGCGVLILIPLLLLLPWRRIAAGRAETPLAIEGKPRAVPAPDTWTVARALRSASFWALVQVFFLTAVGMYLVIVQAVAYLVDTGYDRFEAATAFGVAGMLSMFGVISAGWAADRIGMRLTATISFTLSSLGILALMMMGRGSTVWLLISYVAMFGLSQGARGPIIATLANRIFAGRHVGTIYSIIYATSSIGAALGSWLSGFLHDLTGDYRMSFLASAICLVGAAAPFWIGRALQSPDPRTGR